MLKTILYPILLTLLQIVSTTYTTSLVFSFDCNMVYVHHWFSLETWQLELVEEKCCLLTTRVYISWWEMLCYVGSNTYSHEMAKKGINLYLLSFHCGHTCEDMDVYKHTSAALVKSTNHFCVHAHTLFLFYQCASIHFMLMNLG